MTASEGNGPSGADTPKLLASTQAREPAPLPLRSSTGKPMTGMIYVAEGGFRNEGDLRAWVRRGLDNTSTPSPK